MPRRRKTPKPQPINLLSLPAELLSKIGKLAVDQKDTFYRHSEYYRDHPSKTLSYQPPITQVCRVMREELLPYFYRTKIPLAIDGFRDDHSYVSRSHNGRELARWLRSIGTENRRCLEDVWVRFSYKGEFSKESAVLRRVWRVRFELKVDEEEQARAELGAVCRPCAVTSHPGLVCRDCREQREKGIVDEWEPSWWRVVFK